MASNYLREKEFLLSFGERLREVRTLKGFTQEQLANECDLPTSQVGRIERGQINTSISHVYRIAKALGVHPLELWNFEV